VAPRRLFVSAALLWAAGGTAPARAKLVAEWCQAGKLKAVGAYEACLLAAESAALLEGREVDASRCLARFARRFGRAEMYGYGMCPSEGDQAAVQGSAETHVDEVAAALAGPRIARPSERCVAAKLRAVGAHLACRFGGEAAEVWRGPARDPARCDAKLSAKLARADARGDGVCPTAGDAAALLQMDGAHVGEVLNALGGPAPLCGNGILGANESCDGPDFGGLDCVQLGYGGGGSLVCDDACGLDTSACIEGPPCDVLAQDCPLPGYACYAYFDGNRCLPEGTGDVGDVCTFPTDCQGGLVCTATHPGTPLCAAP
jgi:hypothetical protein